MTSTRTQQPSPPASPATQLTARGVSFGYEPGQPVLNNLSATLVGGQLCALIGPNAAGKSTLLRLLLGQLDPWSGTVELNGENITGLSWSQRARSVSYVPQRTSAGFAFTVEEVIAMGRHSLTPSGDSVERALETCELQPLRRRVYTHLSAGQQQRVVLARAMAQADGSGRVMLLDEPGSAMDLWHLHRTMGQLRSLAKSGLAVLAVVHDPNLAARYADVVWLMDQGRLVADGSWENVLTPANLGAVYRVRIQLLPSPSHDRPIIDIAPVGA